MRWLPVVLLATVLFGCHRNGPPSAQTSMTGTQLVPSTVEYVESATRLAAGEPVFDPESGCQVDVPDGWIPWKVGADPSMVVRLERPGPYPLRVEVYRGRERVPEGGEGFFDRGPYLAGAWEDQVVAVWSRTDPELPGVRQMGVLLSEGVREVVVEGWLPDEEFEAAKRAFDAVVQGTTFVD